MSQRDKSADSLDQNEKVRPSGVVGRPDLFHCLLLFNRNNKFAKRRFFFQSCQCQRKLREGESAGYWNLYFPFADQGQHGFSHAGQILHLLHISALVDSTDKDKMKSQTSEEQLT